MDTLPARIIIQVFTKAELSETELTRLRAQLVNGLESQGRRLVDLIIDRGPAKRDPAEHESLVRIARGDADGIGLFTFPLRLSPSPRKSADVLGSHLTGPFLFLNAAELADRGLLPGGTRYPPEREKVDLAAHGAALTRPIWEAAARAAQLRGQHLTFRKIAEHLEAEGFRPPRGGRWFASTVGQLLKRSEPVRVHTHSNQARTH